jgi:hypothetical protein
MIEAGVMGCSVGSTIIIVFLSTHFERVGVGVRHGWMAARLISLGFRCLDED